MKPETRRAWITYGIVMSVIVALGFIVYPFDVSISQTIQRVGEFPGDARRILALSELVAHGSGILILLVAVWYLAPHLRLHIPRVAACAFFAGLMANGVKLVSGRLRPLASPPDLVDSSATWQGFFPAWNEASQTSFDYAIQSFPSAHSATAVGFAIGMSWLFPRGRNLFFAVAILAGIQRIVFMAHWPSDVVFGSAVGLISGFCFTVPGTLGNWMFNRLEWRLGIGRQIDSISLPVDSDRVHEAPEKNDEQHAA